VLLMGQICVIWDMFVCMGNGHYGNCRKRVSLGNGVNF